VRRVQDVAHRRRAEATPHERAPCAAIAGADERRLSPPHGQQCALDGRRGLEVGAAQPSRDRDLPGRLLQEREHRLARRAGELLRRLALHDQHRFLGGAREDASHERGRDRVRDVRHDRAHVARPGDVERVGVVALDVRAADEARPQGAEEPHVLLDRDHVETGVGERRGERAAARAEVEDQRPRPLPHLRDDRAGDPRVAQEVLRQFRPAGVRRGSLAARGRGDASVCAMA